VEGGGTRAAVSHSWRRQWVERCIWATADGQTDVCNFSPTRKWRPV